MIYPSYFRKNGRCVKVLSETRTMIITLPPESDVPERFTTTFPSHERMVERLQGWTQVDESKWKEFQFTFWQGCQAERDNHYSKTI